MPSRFQLLGLKDAELLSDLSKLAARCNELTAEVLAHLAEVEHRMLYAELGFPSLHAYCVHELKMSEGAAGRRVIAARVARRFPEVFERVARGELHLSAVCALGPRVTAENAAELFAGCAGKSRRAVEELLAARFPRADVREQIRRLPEVEALSEGRFGVRFTADAELRELIERAREVARYRNPSGNLAGLMKLALLAFIRGEEKRRFGVGSKGRGIAAKQSAAVPSGLMETRATPISGAAEMRAPKPGGARELRAARRTSARSTPSGGVANARTTPPGGVKASSSPPGGAAAGVKRGRHVAMAVRRKVFARDGGRCSFVSSEGRRCEARGWLEFDHVSPWAKGGDAGIGNMRLRCRAHNVLHARRCFGALHLAARVAARRAA